MLLFLANVSPSFLRELPPVEINKGHPSEKAKSGSSQRVSHHHQCLVETRGRQRTGELCGGQRDSSGAPRPEAGAPGKPRVGQLQAGHPCHWLRCIGGFLWLVVICRASVREADSY